MLLALALLAGGRVVRHRMLLGPDGDPRRELWLDGLLAAATPPAADARVRTTRPRLTAPLPLNTCGADSLTLLPGVGPVLAGRIAALRAAGTVFRGPDDLRRVKGIGPKVAARLAPHVRFAPPDTSATRTGG